MCGFCQYQGFQYSSCSIILLFCKIPLGKLGFLYYFLFFFLIYLATPSLWRRKWHPTPVLLPGNSHRRRSLVGCRLWGHTDSDTTEVTQQQHTKSQLGTRDLFQLQHAGFFFFKFWHANSQLWHVRSSSLTRDQTQGPLHCGGGVSHWTTKEVPLCYLL